MAFVQGEVPGAGKAHSLVALARTCVAGMLDERRLAHQSDEEALGELDALPGIGAWSAQYALLRGMGRLNVFPSADAGGRRGLRRMFSLAESPGKEWEERILRRWRPFAGLVS